MIIYLIIFFVVLSINIVPFFMPATWTVLVYFIVKYDVKIFPLVIIGVVAATLGRVVLLKLSRFIIRQKFLSEKSKSNIHNLEIFLEKKKNLSKLFFLSYSLSPIPSNHLFIAYGLTSLPIKNLVAPFFIGRLISYGVISITTDKFAEAYLVKNFSAGKYFSIYFISAQILTILIPYAFTKIPWKKLVSQKVVLVPPEIKN